MNDELPPIAPRGDLGPEEPAQPVSLRGTPIELRANAAGDRLIVDTDIGTHSALGLLNDDAQALFMLTQAGVDVLGVTTVSGNSWAGEAATYALRQLERVGRADVPVYQGLSEPLLGSRAGKMHLEQALFGTRLRGAWTRPEPPPGVPAVEMRPGGADASTVISDGTAPDFIARTILESPGEVTVLAIGPMTNLAVAIKNHPEIARLAKRIVCMGGAFDVPGNVNPSSEFNIWFDPEAAHIVWGAPWPVQVIVPLDVTESVRSGIDEYTGIVSGAATTITDQYRDVQAGRFAREPAATNPIPDAVAAGVLLDPTLITSYSYRYVTVDTNYGPGYGRALGYQPGLAPDGLQRAIIVESVDRDRFFQLMVSLLGSPLRAAERESIVS